MSFSSSPNLRKVSRTISFNKASKVLFAEQSVGMLPCLLRVDCFFGSQLIC